MAKEKQDPRGVRRETQKRDRGLERGVWIQVRKKSANKKKGAENVAPRGTSRENLCRIGCRERGSAEEILTWRGEGGPSRGETRKLCSKNDRCSPVKTEYTSVAGKLKVQ